MAVIKSYDSTDEAIVDPISKAIRITAYNPDGTVQYPAIRASYLAYSGSFTPAATPTDIFSISGSTTKLIKIFRVSLVSTQTIAGINSWSLVKRATANTGGTATVVAAVRSDSNDPAETAVVRTYSANPALGALIGNAWSGFIGAPAQPPPPPTQPGLAGLVGITIDFTEFFGKPIFLRSPSDVLAWNFGGAALPAGLSIRAGFNWTEENV